LVINALLKKVEAPASLKMLGYAPAPSSGKTVFVFAMLLRGFPPIVVAWLQSPPVRIGPLLIENRRGRTYNRLIEFFCCTISRIAQNQYYSTSYCYCSFYLGTIYITCLPVDVKDSVRGVCNELV
jgi:hypothetical protein